jgi:WD repeat-containing protein 48
VLQVLEIILDESDVFSAWLSAKDAGFADKAPDAKINYGGMLLKSLFEHWPLSYVESGEAEMDSPLHGFFSLPPHTPVLIRHFNETDQTRSVYRTTARDASNQSDSVMLREHLPAWVLDVCQHNQFPKFNKIPFLLQPHASFAAKHVGKRDRLSATEMLLVRKVMEHVFEKILYPSPDGGEACNGAGPPLQQPSMPAPIPANIEEKVELFCNDQKLDPEMDLRTVKHFIWKQGGDLILHYRPVK